MKIYLIRFTLLKLVLAATACSDNDKDDNEVEEIKSFSSLTRDVFNAPENAAVASVVEGVDFKFEAADELETYSDLLNN